MVSDLQPGQQITDFLIIRHKEIRTKKESTETYLSLELGDASGRIFGSFWGDVMDVEAALTPGELVKVRATVIDWHGRPHLSITKIRPVYESDDVSLDSFLPCSQKSFSELFAEFQAHAFQVQNQYLTKLLDVILNDDKFASLLKRAPGGKLWHHCYLGGLLEHSTHVAELALSIAQHYEHINADLLLTGALLHDIGKVFEYKWNGFIDFSDTGRLHGHIAIGYHLIAQHIENIQDFPDSLRDELLHLVLSHQGKPEQGSAVVPMMREAIILNYADEIDSKLGAFERIYEKEYKDGRQWSNYVKLMDRFLYFGHAAQ